jgi:hypothetical protein
LTVRHLGISPTLLGNTAVAASVEAEEVARVAVPARRGRPELALGTIGGTIVHFAALNAGVIALVRPLELGHDTTRFYLPVAAASPAILAAVLLSRKRRRRCTDRPLRRLHRSRNQHFKLMCEGPLANRSSPYEDCHDDERHTGQEIRADANELGGYSADL